MGAYKWMKRAQAMLVPFPTHPILPILLSPALVPTAQVSILLGHQSQRKKLLSSTSLAAILRQTSDWLGTSHMLIPEPITVAGGMQSPDWLALGHVPSYITQLHPNHPDCVRVSSLPERKLTPGTRGGGGVD